MTEHTTERPSNTAKNPTAQAQTNQTDPREEALERCRFAVREKIAVCNFLHECISDGDHGMQVEEFLRKQQERQEADLLQATRLLEGAMRDKYLHDLHVVLGEDYLDRKNATRAQFLSVLSARAESLTPEQASLDFGDTGIEALRTGDRVFKNGRRYTILRQVT